MKNEEVFFTLLKAGLWGKVNDTPPPNDNLVSFKDVDWEEVYNLASEQSVVGLVAAGIDWFMVHDSRFMVPVELKLQMIGEALQIEQQNADMNKFIGKLVGMMRDAGIYALLVKGQGVARCYEKPLWRSCGDVDLFLSDDNYLKAKELLISLATEVEQEYVGAKHLGMTIDGWVVELHGSLRVGLPNRINRVLDDIRQDTFYGGNVRSWNNNGTQVFLLGKENDIVYVFVHFLNHFYKGGIGLRQICDWCRLLWTYRDSLDHELLETRIRKMGLMSEWKAFGALAIEYLGFPKDSMPLLDVRSKKEDVRWRKKADRIMEFILKSGNMGHKRGSWLMEHDSWLSRQYVVRKAFSMFRRISDLINHARIFPLDSLRFFPRIMFNGVRSAMRGE